MTWLTEDPQRLAAFRRGDPQTLAELYTRYALDVAATLARRAAAAGQLSAAFDLDDLVQETFIRAFAERARSSYDGQRSFRSYLLSIAQNLATDRWRRARHYEPVLATETRLFEEEPAAELASEPAPTPESRAIAAELTALFDRFLASLDDVDRRIATLRLARGLARREVASACGLSAMQLRTREKRLRERLFDQLLAAGYVDAGSAAIATLLLGAAAWPLVLEVLSWHGAAQLPGA